MKKNSNNRKIRYIILAVCFAIVVSVIAIIPTQHTGVENLYNANTATENFLDGIFSGDGAAAAEGGRQLLGTMWNDVKNLLFIVLIFIAFSAVLYAGYRIYRAKHRDHFTEEDEDDDYWNT